MSSRYSVLDAPQSTNYQWLEDGKNNTFSINGSSADDEGSYWKRKQRRCSCCRGGCVVSNTKFWSSSFLFSCLLITTIVCIGLYVIAPILLKDVVNKSELVFQNITITDPDDTNLNTRLISQAYISLSGPYSAYLESMPISVYQVHADQSTSLLGTMQMSAVTIHGGGDSPISIDNIFYILDFQAFNAFTHSMIFDQSVRWQLRGSAVITPSIFGLSLPTYRDIPFDKIITLQACNKLLDVQLLVFDLSMSTVDSIKCRLLTKIVNPSIFNVSPLGNLRFGMYYEGSSLGFLESDYTSMYSGPNEVWINGVLKPDNLTAANVLVNRFLTGQTTAVQAVASLNASSIGLYSKGMAGLVLTTVLQPYQRPLVKSLIFNHMTMTPSFKNRTIEMYVEAEMFLDNPLGPISPLNISTIIMKSTMIYKGQILGETTSDPSPVSPIYPDGIPTPSTDRYLAKLVLLMSLIDDVNNEEDAYSMFVSDFTNNVNVSITLNTTASTTASYALGPIQVDGLSITSDVTLTGMAGLTNTQVKSFSIHDKSCDDEIYPCGVAIDVNAYIYNPSVASVYIGDSRMALYHEKTLLGYVYTHDLSFEQGDNNFSLSGELLPPQPQDIPVVSDFMVNYMLGKDQLTTLKGSMLSSNSSSSGSNQPSADMSAGGETVNAMSVSTYMPGIANFQPLGHQSIESLSMKLNHQNQHITTSGKVRSMMYLPANVDMAVKITSVTFPFNMFALNQGEEYTLMASVDGAALPCVSQYLGLTDGKPTYSLELLLEDIPLRIINTTSFSLFLNETLNSASVGVHIEGTGSAVVSGGLGSLTLSGIPSADTTYMTTFNGFKTPDGQPLINVQSFDVPASTPDSVTVQPVLTVYNPTNISMINSGFVEFDMYYSNSYIARVHIDDFTLQPGLNTYVATAKYTPPANGTTDYDHAVEFLSNYINGVTSVNYVVGALKQADGNYQCNVYWNPMCLAMLNYQIYASLPPSPIQFINHFFAHADFTNLSELWKMFTTKIFPCSTRVYNTFSQEVWIVYADIKIYAGPLSANHNIAYWLEDRSSNPVVLAAKAETTTTDQAIKVPSMMDWTLFKTVISIFLKPPVKLSIDGWMNVLIGGKDGLLHRINLHVENVDATVTKH